jgi:hypothetical protein
MPRYIDAEPMPHGPLWDELTDKEKANVLCYLISMPGASVVREIFDAVEGILVEPNSNDKVLWTTKEAFKCLREEYNVYP